jgi:DNA-directed RNA polymerase subunit RPC12/RpoP
MLKNIDYTGKNKTEYICDKCGRDINNDNLKRFKININTPKKNSKSTLKTYRSYDLCSRCTTVIIKYLENK